MSDDIEDILQGCLLGDKTCQQKLYDTFAPKMFGVCLRYSKDEDEAKDFLQEGFIKVFQNLGKYKSEGSFEGWLRRVIVNHTLEQFRKAYKKQKFVEIEEAHGETSENFNFENHDFKIILEAIQSLSIGYRTVFNLYVMEGYQHNEIAEMMGINESTSKSQLSRARQLLQKKLAIFRK